MRIYIETYGCALNKGDTYIMKTVLRERGHSIVCSLDEADVIIVNTCTVRYDTQQKMIKRITSLDAYAREKGKKLIIAGCMAEAQPYLINKIAPNASLVSPQNSSRIWIAVESQERVILLSGIRDRRVIGCWLENRVATIPIQEGCLGNCSFCIVKNARRRLVSYPIDVIVKTAEKLVSRGAVEIELAGQDTATYGIDVYGEKALPRLIKKVASIKGSFMIRVGMMNPDTMIDILDELIEVLRHPRVYKFLHIPVQSGSNKVLQIMRRKYAADDFIYIVRKLRKTVPGISIATDIIVGHPGEDEEDFEQTLSLLQATEPERVHLAQYSIRPNTASARMPQVSTREKKKRMLRILKVVEEIGLKKNKSYIGSTALVLVTENTQPYLTGRLYNYTPVVLHNAGGDALGKYVKAEIIDATFFDLRATIT